MSEQLHSIRVESDKCTGRMACLKACPTEAIRVRAGRARILEDRCIDCGECARVCPREAIVPWTSSFTEFSRFKYTVALPSPVLYGQFRQDITPHMVLAALKEIGFDDAFDMASATEAVSIAIGQYLGEYRRPLPLVSPFCPAIVRLIQIRYPNLIDTLIPIESPMEIAAREVKQEKSRELGLKEHEIGVIYITPCPVKMVAIKDPPRKRKSHLDGAVAMSEIYHPLRAQLARLSEDELQNPPVTGVGLGWPVLGRQATSLKAQSSLAVGGLGDVEDILEEIENGKLSDVQYVEFQACRQGCCGGSLTVKNPYVTRARVLELLEQYGSTPSQDREQVQQRYQEGYYSLPGGIPARPSAPLDVDIARAIEKKKRIQETRELLPGIDCGACGSPTCRSFAEDVVLERAAIEDCPVRTFERFRMSTVDPYGDFTEPEFPVFATLETGNES